MAIIRNFPALTILLSLFCAGIGFALKEKRRAKALSIFLLCICFLLNLSTVVCCGRHGSFTYMMGHYPAPWGNELSAGTCESLVTTAFNLVMLLTVIGGYEELEHDIDEKKINLYFVMINLINAALMALVYTNDVFSGYVFIEICTMASIGILMISGFGRTTLAATRYMIMSLVGSGLFLLGVILLYDITGHLLMPYILDAVAKLWASGAYHMPLLIVAGLISLGIAIKSGMFPFHFWMPDTYGEATPVSAGILSGVISKGYIFLLIKIIYRAIGTDVFYGAGIRDVLFIFGIFGMIIGSIGAIGENDINRMTALSSAAQIGYIYMGIGLSPALGVTAALFHMLAHAVTKPMIFLANAKLCTCSGGSRHFHDLRGAGIRNKTAGAAFVIGSLSMVGIPGFMGFVSKLLFAQAGIDGGVKLEITLAALAVSTILNTMYFLRTVITLYAVKEAPAKQDKIVGVKEQMGFAAAVVCFTLVNIALGMHSQPIVTLIAQGL